MVFPKRSEKAKNILAFYSGVCSSSEPNELFYSFDDGIFLKYASFEIKIYMYNKAA